MIANHFLSAILALPIAFNIQNYGSIGTSTDILVSESRGQDLTQKQISQIRVVAEKIPPELLRQRTHEVIDFAGTYRAYIIPISVSEERIAIEDLKTKTIYTVQILPSLPRPFSNLKWVWNSDRKSWVLSLERWATPHFGYLYEIDIKQRKLIREVPISG
ncbi:hypothetical protein V2H45_15015 [Tumidithrix elongata RA019]|uniref:Uncharacterized protein n=1 Tax=Tumidithrix elongata BACA0141 TaxID=2716417 RepID=A0AAW9Q473_9CYAN|nr:hypothetical protein [Tumidithrix elongata RA019]